MLRPQRNTIISGDYEPTDPECEFTLDDEISQEMEDKAKIAEGNAKLHDMDEDTKVGRERGSVGRSVTSWSTGARVGGGGETVIAASCCRSGVGV